MAKHPGRTAAQRRTLDEIGCGNHSPVMAKSTRDAMLRAGLIIELEPDTSKSFGPFQIIIRRFEMSIPAHIQWCEAMSAQSERTGA